MPPHDTTDQSTSKLIQNDSGPFIRVAHKSITYPTVKEFDDYIKSKSIGTRGNQVKMTGYKLRRLVVMHNEGRSYKEIADAINISKGVVAKWWNDLPLELRGKTTKQLSSNE